MALEEGEEEKEEDEYGIFSKDGDNEPRDIQYVRGDVTYPINTRGTDAIIVHCTGEKIQYLSFVRCLFLCAFLRPLIAVSFGGVVG